MLQSFIKDIPNFPKEGIIFKDISPLWADANALKTAADALAAPYLSQEIDFVVGIESRGFILGAMMAERLNAGFIPIRKAGKLPSAVFRQTYSLEYGADVMEIHKDAFPKNAKILLHDDVLASGGTAKAALELLKQGNANVVGTAFLLELLFLDGRSVLDNNVHSVIQYA